MPRGKPVSSKIQLMLEKFPEGLTTKDLAKKVGCKPKAAMNAITTLRGQGVTISQTNGKGSPYFIDIPRPRESSKHLDVQNLPPTEQAMWLEFHQKALLYTYCKDAVVKAYEETSKLRKKVLK